MDEAERRAEQMINEVFEEVEPFTIWCYIDGHIAAVSGKIERIQEVAARNEGAIIFEAELV